MTRVVVAAVLAGAFVAQLAGGTIAQDVTPHQLGDSSPWYLVAPGEVTVLTETICLVVQFDITGGETGLVIWRLRLYPRLKYYEPNPEDVGPILPNINPELDT